MPSDTGHLTKNFGLASPQFPWANMAQTQGYISNTSANPTAATILATTTTPGQAADLTTTNACFCLRLDPVPYASLRFLGGAALAGDPNNYEANLTVVGVAAHRAAVPKSTLIADTLSGPQTQWLRSVILTAKLTVGNTAAPTNCLAVQAGSSLGWKWVDTIDIAGTDYSFSPGARVGMNIANGAAELLIDTASYSALLVYLSCSAHTGGTPADGLSGIWRQF